MSVTPDHQTLVCGAESLAIIKNDDVACRLSSGGLNFTNGATSSTLTPTNITFKTASSSVVFPSPTFAPTSQIKQELRVEFSTPGSIVYDTIVAAASSTNPDASTTVRGLVNTGTQSFGGHKTFVDTLKVPAPVDPEDAVNLAAMRTFALGQQQWLRSVISFTDIQLVVAPPTGARYAATVTGGGFIKDNVYEKILAGWEMTPAVAGCAMYCDSDNKSYIYTDDAPQSWSPIGVSVDHNDLTNKGTLTHAQLETAIGLNTAHRQITTGADPHSGQALQTTASPTFSTLTASTSVISPYVSAQTLGVGDWATVTGDFEVGGATTLSGICGIAGKLLVDDVIQATGALNGNSLDITNGAVIGAGLTVTGGTALESLGVSGGITTAGVLKTTNTAASTDYLTGALQVAGGAGITGAAYVGGGLNVTGDITTSDLKIYHIGATNIIESNGDGVTPGSFQEINFVGRDLFGYKFTISPTEVLAPNATVTGYLTANGIVSFAGLKHRKSGTRTVIQNVGDGVTDGSFNQIEIRGYNETTERMVIYSGMVDIPLTTVSTAVSNGALRVAGGVGISGALFGTAATLNGALTLSGTTGTTLLVSSTQAATTTTTGALRVAGGVGIVGKVYIGGGLNATGTPHVITGALSGITTLGVSGVLTNTSATASTSVSTGALVLSGASAGLGVAGKAFIGTGVTINSGGLTLGTGTAITSYYSGNATYNSTIGSGQSINGIVLYAEMMNGNVRLWTNSEYSASAPLTAASGLTFNSALPSVLHPSVPRKCCIQTGEFGSNVSDSSQVTISTIGIITIQPWSNTNTLVNYPGGAQNNILLPFCIMYAI